MFIVVLGASSEIGRSLAKVFAPGNDLLLAGRDGTKLERTRSTCAAHGASNASVVVADLGDGPGALFEGCEGKSVDLLIDAAAAASAIKDEDIKPEDFAKLVEIDVLSRIRLVNGFAERQGRAPAVILISTVLCRVRSPGRVVYSSTKQLYEEFLRSLSRANADLRYLIVHVGKVIDRDRESPGTDALAQAVSKAYRGGKKAMLFGSSGRMMVGLFHLQPIVFRAAVALQRAGRKLAGRLRTT